MGGQEGAGKEGWEGWAGTRALHEGRGGVGQPLPGARRHAPAKRMPWKPGSEKRSSRESRARASGGPSVSSECDCVGCSAVARMRRARPGRAARGASKSVSSRSAGRTCAQGGADPERLDRGT